MPIFHRGNPSKRISENLSIKPSLSNKDNRSAAQKIFGKSPASKTKDPQGSQSAFGERSSINRQEFRSWLRKQPEFRKHSSIIYPNLSEDRRIKEIEKNIWGGSGGKWGSLIEKGTKEPERRKFEYEKELRTSKVMNNIKLRNLKRFEAGMVDKFIEKK